ncbi:MAG: glycosyltransferase family 2 protein, partial [Novipirellula sp. JB048]
MNLELSVVILTFNEQEDIRGCIDEAQSFSDDIHVIDSGSTDDTVSLAEQCGAEVWHHPFSGFGEQRNWAIDHVPHQHQWVLHLDADERPTVAFVQELRQILESDPDEAGFYVPSKLMLGNQWLRRSSGYPIYQVRLFHRERLRFENYGHGQREVTKGLLGYMQEPYLHYAFSKGLEQWMRKHVGYAAKEAAESAVGRSSCLQDIRDCLHSDPIIRRRSLKRLSYLLPARSYL